MRVAVAMSGGIDSSVALGLLHQAGHDVFGLTMEIWREREVADGASLRDAENAKAVCRQFGVDHHLVDLSEPFFEQVVCYFAQEYALGRTPNPCVRCNRFIKFGQLKEHAQRLGAQVLATGHYARIVRRGEQYYLLRGKDRDKDQSYFLYMLDQQQLSRTLFPLGDYTKDHVRRLAAQWKLAAAGRPESQDVCFVSDTDYQRVVGALHPKALRPGPIVNRSGEQLGRHRGLAFYTIGQRRGLGISAPRPLYVTAIDASNNVLIVGHAEELGQDELIASGVSYITGEAFAEPRTVQAKIRYRAQNAKALVTPLPQARTLVGFDRPQRDITPGQAVVFYDGEYVLGGGTIERSAGNADQYREA